MKCKILLLFIVILFSTSIFGLNYNVNGGDIKNLDLTILQTFQPDEYYIISIANGTTFLSSLNETRLNQTIFNIALYFNSSSSVANLTQLLNDEIQARIGNETVIYSLIGNETQQRIDNDTLLQTNIDNEQTSRLGNDSLILANLNNETLARNNNETLIYSLITNETQARIDNDTLLQQNINIINQSFIDNVTLINSNLTALWANLSNINYTFIVDNISLIYAALGNETQARIDNDTLLQTNINTVNQSFIDNVTLINSNLTALWANLSNINYTFIVDNISLIYAALGNETQARIDNDTLLQYNINLVNSSLLDINNSLWGNLTELNSVLTSQINNETQARIDNDTLLQQNINAVNQSMLNNISTLNTNLGIAINDNITKLNNTIMEINSTLWNEVNLKGTLVGNNLWIGNNSFLGNVIIWNATQINQNSSIILKDGLGVVVFNVTLTGDVYATQFYGSLNASYILNAPWLLATDQRYNETLAITGNATLLQTNINAVNQSLINNVTQLQNNINTVNLSRIGNETLLQTNINAVNLSLINNVSAINTNLTSIWSNMSKYIANFTDAKLNNVTINKLYINSTTSWMYFDTTTNTTYLRFLNGNLSFWDGSDPVLTMTQNDDVNIRNNLFVGNNLTSNNELFAKRISVSNDLQFITQLQFPNSPLTIASNVNGYMQIVIRNRNDSNLSSSDLVLGADLMTDTNNYIDLGYNSNAYNDPVYSGTDKNSGYLINYATGNLSILSSSAGIKFGTGGVTASNIRMTIDATGNVTLTNQLNMQNNTKICMGDKCQTYIMYNSTGGFGEFG